MGRAQQETLRTLRAAEQQMVEASVTASSERVDRVRRARAVRVGAETGNLAEAARQAGYRRGTPVAHVVQRFNRRGLAALTIAAGGGPRPTHAGAARAPIVAVAQEPPRRREDQTATWALRTVQRRRRHEGRERRGTSPLRGVLQDAGRASPRPRTWGPTGTAVRPRTRGAVPGSEPQTEEKSARSAAADRLAAQEGGPLWGHDEAGPSHAIPQRGASGAPQGNPLRHPQEYGRGGTAPLVTLCRPARGEVRAQGVRRTSTAVLPPWLRAERPQIVQDRPEVTPCRTDAPSSRTGGTAGRRGPTATTIRRCA
jgi:hypothetical protein